MLSTKTGSWSMDPVWTVRNTASGTCTSPPSSPSSPSPPDPVLSAKPGKPTRSQRSGQSPPGPSEWWWSNVARVSTTLTGSSCTKPRVPETRSWPRLSTSRRTNCPRPESCKKCRSNFCYIILVICKIQPKITLGCAFLIDGFALGKYVAVTIWTLPSLVLIGWFEKQVCIPSLVLVKVYK